MGVKNLFQLIERYAPGSIKYTYITKYKNKKLAFDTNLLIYKMVYAIRKNGYDLTNDDICVTHIHSLLMKLKSFVKYNITAVFVFDGLMPQIKEKTMRKRNQFQKQMKKKYDDALTDEEKKKYYFMKSDISYEEIMDCIELIKLFGFSVIIAPQEADSQLAYLGKNKIVDYIVSDDMDLLVFGSPNILKNFTVNPNNKIQEISLKTFLNKAKLTQENLIDLSILLGCDYCEGQKGIVGAYKYITSGMSIENKKVSDYYKHPKVNTNIEVNTNKINIDYNALRKFLEDKKFKVEYIQKIFDDMSKKIKI